MRKNLFQAVLSISLALSASFASAESLSDQKISELENRIKTLEEKAGTQEKRPLLSSFGEHKISLLLQMRALYEEAGHDEFNGRRAELKLLGTLVPQKVSYVLMIDPISLSNKITQDAYINLTYIPHADIQFGQLKYPQGLESRVSSADLDLAERAIVTRQFEDKRDYAFQISGAADHSIKTEYAIAALNGSGRNNPENNNHKDLAARVGLGWNTLWIGAHGYLGQEPTGDRTRAGAEARIINGPLKIQGEFIAGKTEKALVGPSSRQCGYYAFVSYLWRSLRPAIRWESWDPDLDTADNRRQALTAGFDVMLTADRKNKITINYALNREEGTSINNDEALLQLQVAF